MEVLVIAGRIISVVLNQDSDFCNTTVPDQRARLGAKFGSVQPSVSFRHQRFVIHSTPFDLRLSSEFRSGLLFAGPCHTA